MKYYCDELKDGSYGIFYDEYEEDISFSNRLCVIEDKKQAIKLINELNDLYSEKEYWKTFIL